MKRPPPASRAAPEDGVATGAGRPGRRKAGAGAEEEVVLPYLRFSRDKRGYEHTFVIHSDRRRGRARTRILYWFRTPPGVKVGRSALDESAIRSIEERNPDIEFDWASILKEQPPPESAPAPPSRSDAGPGARGAAPGRAAARTRQRGHCRNAAARRERMRAGAAAGPGSRACSPER